VDLDPEARSACDGGKRVAITGEEERKRTSVKKLNFQINILFSQRYALEIPVTEHMKFFVNKYRAACSELFLSRF
jgi:hypothetical protein